MCAMIDRPGEGTAPAPWRERDDIRTSVHGTVLAAFERAIAEIGALSVLIQQSALETTDKDQAMDYLAVAATRTLQANIVYVEKSVLHGPGRA